MIMTMKITQLRTYWDAGDANIVLAFLDELREVLLATYGDEIIEMHRNTDEDSTQYGQTELPFDDRIEF
jgi:hypothetical protein